MKFKKVGKLGAGNLVTKLLTIWFGDGTRPSSLILLAAFLSNMILREATLTHPL
jgi:hypothetical protein